ncbi:sensor histidine kinase [Phytohabitans suffuscus]|uniref:histidine kinase n=1 Tax=Phytohabitans suffuscus TaxID=624315 RepID=A0A6F8YKM1_9ACTN|nr:sensor histidine kinase [Phytohabitans suffuscus]BCB86640.1 histidine kinase [Phytohabitans suffuscus]
MKRSWSLRQRVTALCAVVGGLLALVAIGASATAATTRSQVDTLANRATPLRTGSEALLTALVDQETSVRGFALNGNEQDLQPYTSGIAEERRLTDAMLALIEDEQGIRDRLQRVTDGAASWRRDVAEPVITAVRAQGPAAGQVLIDDSSRQQFDQLRRTVEDLQNEIRAFRNGTADEAKGGSNLLVVLLIAATVIVLLAGIALLVSLRRMVIEPLTSLAEQVRAVAGGQYDRPIVTDGPPELATLATDVEGMRQKIASDLAEVREARERIEWVNGQLQSQAEELMRSNRDLEQFAYVASHDLQEPLRKVASFCQLLQRRYAGQLDERADQYIAFAVDGAQRMQRLINDLLAFSRIGRMTAGFTEVDLNVLMADVASQTESARNYANGELTWDELPTVLGEQALLTTLLANLVSNSIKFRHPDRPPRVHISAERAGDEWEISCRDNGIGVEQEFADKIFVIFQRLHAKDSYPGTGIGLAIAKKIVEYHGGRIWVGSDVDEGTVIRFTLPVLTGSEEEPAGENEPVRDSEVNA